MITLDELRRIDSDTKPADAEAEWVRLHAYYDDRSRAETIANLDKLGMGIKGDDRPLELPLLRRHVARLATVYRSPASRWLALDGRRLDDDDETQARLVALLKRMRYDGGWRRVDRLRALFRQVVVRFYASDARMSPVLRVFEPYNVMRAPSTYDADLIDEDRAFAFRVASGGAIDDADAECWELWNRTEDGWHVLLVSGRGDPRPEAEQPFTEFGHICPYDRQPALMVYDEDPLGQAWLHPFQSRSALQAVINAKSNDLTALIRAQAHAEKYFELDDPSDAPSVTGPGTAATLPRGARIHTIQHNAAIRESEGAIRSLAKMWRLSEGIPSADLDDSKTILTGAALRVQNGELHERREEQLELARADEPDAFRRLLSVYNTHAPAWGLPGLPAEAELEVELADVETPVEPLQDQAFWHGEIESGRASEIDWIQRRDGVSRHEAIQIRARITADLDTYRSAAQGERPAPPANPGRPGHPGGEREIDPGQVIPMV